jgi:hypothetical protein
MTMPCSEIFWLNFLDVFPKVLAVSLGILPAALAFWGGFYTIMRWQDRRDQAQHELRYGLGARMDRLEQRVDERLRRVG